MSSNELIVGVDTSNYTTSLALVDRAGEILADLRKPLVVKQGERGLRQSHALFQHMENLPPMIESLFQSWDRLSVKAVAVSEKPRPAEGSYMPVFKSGTNYAAVLSACLGIPCFSFSHQEGHLEAVRYNSPLIHCEEFLAYHLSGGTCELLKVTSSQGKYTSIDIIGGSRDISFGQLLDRIGVAKGMAFPAGRELSQKAFEESQARPVSEKNNRLSAIPMDDLYINLSGIETQCLRSLDEPNLILLLFERIAECLCRLTAQAIERTGIHNVLFSGGVSASSFIRERLMAYFLKEETAIVFGKPELSSDNAVGTALLGGKALWQ